MISRSNLLAAAFAITVKFAVAQDDNGAPFNFCEEGTCQDCPVSLSSAGTGYPNCVIYNSDDVFPNHNFNASTGGGWAPFVDVLQPDPNCQVLIKSPAHSTDAGCGKIVAGWSQATCSAVTLGTTFMVQFCCGEDDCNAAGLANSKRDSRSGGVYLKYSNGTIIEPAEVAPMKSVSSSRRRRASADLVKRDPYCDANSWVADSGYESYTKPADGAQIVLSHVAAGQTVSITKERSSSFSQTLHAGLTIEDILDIGTDFTITEEMSESTTYMFQAPPDQEGQVDFTPILRCSTGTGTCQGGQLHGEICSPYDDSTGKLAGEYSVVVTN